LPTAAFFGAEPATPEQIIQRVEIPFAARYVETPLEPGARQLAAPGSITVRCRDSDEALQK